VITQQAVCNSGINRSAYSRDLTPATIMFRNLKYHLGGVCYPENEIAQGYNESRYDESLAGMTDVSFILMA